MKKYIGIAILVFASSLTFAQQAFKDFFPKPEFTTTKHYICHKTNKKIKIDGKLDDEAWKEASFTDSFIDIEGTKKPKPIYNTKAKMLWNDEYLFIAAIMQEPNLWATLKNKDDIVYFDNDFEVFIDPNWDTHNYYEIEVNAFNTVWDLLVTQPYRDGGPAVNAWDIKHLKSAVYLNGTINNPSDTDNFWSVELAIPIKDLAECYEKDKPEVNDLWKINFSRVQWDLKVVEGKYVKLKKPEHNWVWSAMGIINMHYPEKWGVLQFASIKQNSKVKKINNKHQLAYDVLRQVYYAQRNYNLKHKKFATSLKQLNLQNLSKHNLKFYIAPHVFEIGMKSNNDYIFIQQDGRTYINEPIY